MSSNTRLTNAPEPDVLVNVITLVGVTEIRVSLAKADAFTEAVTPEPELMLQVAKAHEVPTSTEYVVP
jgi:hypothetical protein